MPQTHTGTCYCGAVEIEVTGAPLQTGYCHCQNCRRYSGAPVNAFALWKAENVRITKGDALLGRYESSDITIRRFCTNCGGHLIGNHPTLGLTDVRPAILRGFVFRPAIHLHYEETVLPMKDGLPKFKDFPASAGGSGEMLPE